MAKYIKQFRETGLQDVPEVGGKNASLGEMTRNLAGKGIPVPAGFATTAAAFWHFIDFNGLHEPLNGILAGLDKVSFSNLRETGRIAREMMLNARMPDDLAKEIRESYADLGGGAYIPVAVRSSATAEDLPQASFAGQHESYLNISGDDQVIDAVHRCYASLFTDRAIKYREDHGFEHDRIALSAGIQKMVRSDLSASGVAFTLEPESGFRDIIHISGVWGLGENLVQGTVTPDEFFVFKTTLRQGKNAIIQKKLGEKAFTMIYGQNEPVVNMPTQEIKREQFVLTDEEVHRLAEWCLLIEEHYGMPMDIEWAKDGMDGQIYIIQARPETVQSGQKPDMFREYRLLKKSRVIASGQAVGNRIATGRARILHSPADAHQLQPGEIVVTTLTSPDWDPVLRNSAAIITDKGGRTSHASIVARELGVPAIVGCNNATSEIMDGQMITVSCSEGKTGRVYDGELPFDISETDFSTVRLPESTDVMLIVGDPENAFRLSFYPNHGVGLMRIEFIITHFVQVHPMALVNFDSLQDREARVCIEELTHHYPDKKQYFVEKLAQGIATIAAAFYPKEVIVRMSDFKTNEYAGLIGGAAFEPEEENPMIGFRGASRYYHELYTRGFALECAAVKRVREEMGLENVKVMIPFCRTPGEAQQVIRVMAGYGLDRDADPGLEIYMMAEIPSNVLLAEKFAELFDGFSIGSNDLTQLTLGIDRDSGIISGLFSENDPAARMMISMMIRRSLEAGTRIGLCGQAPSDDPAFARFLVENGISSISFNPDALLKGIENILLAEKKAARPELVMEQLK